MTMRTGDKVIIHPDSKYAIGIAQGLFFPRENVDGKTASSPVRSGSESVRSVSVLDQRA